MRLEFTIGHWKKKVYPSLRPQESKVLTKLNCATLSEGKKNVAWISTTNGDNARMDGLSWKILYNGWIGGTPILQIWPN